MGTLSRFKYIRGVPLLGQGAAPGFQHFSFTPVRSIPTQTFSIHSSGPSDVFGEIYLPANSWAIGKFLRITYGYVLTCITPPIIGPATITELVTAPPSITIGLQTGAPFTASVGPFSSVTILRAYRTSGDAFLWKDGDTSQLWSFNHDDAVQHIEHWFSIPADTDLTTPLTIQLRATLPVLPVAFQLDPMFLTSFVEQAVNLHAAVQS